MAIALRTPRFRSLPHLYRDRLGTYYFRVTDGGRTIKRSLRTKDHALATMVASRMNWEWSRKKRAAEPTADEIIAAFKKDGRQFDVLLPNGMQINGINSGEDAARAKRFVEDVANIGLIEPQHRPPRPEYAHLATKPSRPKRPFLKATKPYLAEMRKDAQNQRKTVEDKESTFAAFAEQFDDPDMASIDKAMAVGFKRKLLESPAGTGRLNTKIGYLSSFLDWAIGNGEAESNPFLGLRVSKKGKLAQTVESYEPFTADELAAIFNPATYPAYASKPHYHWLPFLLLYTGARPDELAKLRLDQVRSEQGIDYFALKASKNSNSIRKVPLHRVVVESGFPSYVATLRKAGPAGQLFPLLKPSKNGYAKNLSRRFNETYLPSLRVDDPTHRLYSFRSSFITRMSELNVNTAMLMALVGHFEQTAVDLSSPHFKNYQGAKLIGAMKQTIDLLDFKLPMAF